jgi:GNAT superfamily N-acetyltransferase
MNKLQIEFLADHPEAIPTLIELFVTEWEPYYGDDGSGDAEIDLKISANHTELPIALVAILHNTICGTAALKKESLTTYPDLSPWLVALVVAPEYRKIGIGEHLVAAIEALAKKLCYRAIYVGTGEKSGMSVTTLQKRNWEFIDKSDYFVSEVSAYRKSF